MPDDLGPKDFAAPKPGGAAPRTPRSISGKKMGEAVYDGAADVPVEAVIAREDAADVKADGFGCHAPAEQMEAQARASGNGDVLDQFAVDYPRGPHDKPESMCPAFGSLRVGLRMRRVATVLSGSACCVYGLTFVSHFYGARRSVGYVQNK